MKLRPLAAACCCLPLASCTGLEPAMIGAALTGAQSGVTLLLGAEVWDFREAPYASVCDAVDRAGARLELTRLNGTRDDGEGRYWVYFRYLGNEKLEVEVTRVTGVVTSVEIDTRTKDQQGMASLFIEVMLDELGETPVRPDTSDSTGR